jgi:predicted transcriptional regulator
LLFLTIGIAPRDYIRKLTAGESRHWVSSMEALGKILSEKNVLLIDMIRRSEPDSVSHVARLSGRAKTNLSKTLNAINRLGLVQFELQKGKKGPHASGTTA